MVSIFSGGRPMTALLFATTIGLSMRIGFLTMADIKSFSDNAVSSRPFDLYIFSLVRINALALMPSIERMALNSCLVGGSLRYSTIRKLTSCFSKRASVARDLLQRGLW